VLKVLRSGGKPRKSGREAAETVPSTEDDIDSPADWREALIEVLLRMTPAAFERLCQRLLRESGFIEVEVTGRSGDGGIDGHGIIRVAGLISFPVMFQCKRYRGNAGASTVRDFRGAMMGRADKGLIISTGGFTRDARGEATRDGAPPIDLIDGDLLSDKLKELSLGVRTRQVEQIEIDADWFGTL
jgi:restriction system protein